METSPRSVQENRTASNEAESPAEAVAVCDDCGAEFCGKKRKTHTAGAVACGSLAQHWRAKHSTRAEKVVCDICSSSFVRLNDLFGHIAKLHQGKPKKWTKRFCATTASTRSIHVNELLHDICASAPCLPSAMCFEENTFQYKTQP